MITYITNNPWPLSTAYRKLAFLSVTDRPNGMRSRINCHLLRCSVIVLVHAFSKPTVFKVSWWLLEWLCILSIQTTKYGHSNVKFCKQFKIVVLMLNVSYQKISWLVDVKMAFMAMDSCVLVSSYICRCNSINNIIIFCRLWWVFEWKS